MKAMVIRATGGPDALCLETLPDPTPGALEVIIKVAACGICFHDIVTRNGTLKRGIQLPLIPGHEVSGTIAALGREVTGLRVGDRVATSQRSFVCGGCGFCRNGLEPLCDDAQFLGDAGLNGGYAEYVVVSGDAVVAVPDGVELEAASIAACAIGTSLHAIRSVGRVQVGETVLVTGAGGGLGIHAVQLARAAGAVVIAQTTSPAKAAAIRDAGAHHAVVSARGGDFSAEVRELTKGHGVNVAIDTVGTAVFTATRRSLAKAGRWVLVGQLTGEFVPFNPAQLFLKSISMLSATSATRQELAETLGLMASGAVNPVIAGRFPLAGAANAHRLVESGKALGRVLVRPFA